MEPVRAVAPPNRFAAALLFDAMPLSALRLSRGGDSG